tara:strand:+ start:1118 stop:1477 length:360 start_codon:yes stop_codon:yes gene_type:complete
MLLIAGDKKVLMKKNRMKVTRQGRVYKSSETKHFEAYVRNLAAVACAEQDWDCVQGDVSFSMFVCFGDKRKRDLQNCFASVCDALEGIVYDNDSQIKFITGSKMYMKGVWGFRIQVDVC